MVRPAREKGLREESRSLRLSRHHWWVVVLSVALVGALGYGSSFLETPWHRWTAGFAHQAGPFVGAGFGALAGLVFGAGIASLLSHPHRVTGRSEIEEELDLPVLASMPVVGRWGGRGADGQGGIGFAWEKGPLLVASLGLVASLTRLGFGRTVKVLLVAGAKAGEGASATAVDLALCLALSGERVIVVDGDLRHPSLHRYLQIDSQRGLSDVLLGTATWRDAVLPVPVARLAGWDVVPARGRDAARSASNLYCLTSGSEPEGHHADLGGRTMRGVLKELASVTDHVILDGPPFFLTPDALDLADMTDGILVVSRLGAHRVDEMRRFSQVLAAVRGKILGVVVTGVALKDGSDVDRVPE